jgi:hypothetical protein
MKITKDFKSGGTLTTGISDLNTSLADVDRDDFTHYFWKIWAIK